MTAPLFVFTIILSLFDPSEGSSICSVSSTCTTASAPSGMGPEGKPHPEMTGKIAPSQNTNVQKWNITNKIHSDKVSANFARQQEDFLIK